MRRESCDQCEVQSMDVIGITSKMLPRAQALLAFSCCNRSITRVRTKVLQFMDKHLLASVRDASSVGGSCLRFSLGSQ